MSLSKEISHPLPACLPMYMIQGDTFETKIFQMADEGDEPGTTIPGMLAGCLFDLEIKTHPTIREPLFKSTPDMFFLGQSKEALVYEMENPLPAHQEVWDELFISIPPAHTKIPIGCWYYSLKITYADSKELTILADRCTVVTTRKEIHAGL